MLFSFAYLFFFKRKVSDKSQSVYSQNAKTIRKALPCVSFCILFTLSWKERSFRIRKRPQTMRRRTLRPCGGSIPPRPRPKDRT